MADFKMIEIFTEQELQKVRCRELLPLKCEYCGSVFNKSKNLILKARKNKNRCRFCNLKCSKLFSLNKIRCNCAECKTEIYKHNYELTNSNNIFCSSSCSAKFYNKRRKFGYRRSNFEIYI